MVKEVLIAFSAHRLEAIPFYQKAFNQADIIILEDAPHPLFPSLLLDQITPEFYVKSLDTDFPLFLTKQYQLLQKVYKLKKKVTQIDPYVEKLLQMYQFLEEGKTPQEIRENPSFKEVYACEHEASGKLLEFYQAAMENDFEKAIQTVCAFAKADAQRISLRDKLRAQAIAHYLREKNGQVFIEAGYIHLFLAKYLQRLMPQGLRVRTTFLLARPACEISKKILGKTLPHPFVPGDLLTFWYLAQRAPSSGKKRLWAARTLIYNKLLVTEELKPTENVPFPHLVEEFKIKALLSQLSYEDCAKLYEVIKFLPRQKAWEWTQKTIGVSFKS